MRNQSDDLDDLDTDLARLVADERAADAARTRIRERHLRAAASTDATLAGVLLDLAEGTGAVSVRTISGRTIQGTIALVGLDAVAIETARGSAYIRLDAIAVIRPRLSATAEPAGHRPAPRQVSFATLVAELAADRPRVAIALTGEPQLLTGALWSAGTDVLTVRLEAEPPITVYVATAQVSELAVLASG